MSQTDSAHHTDLSATDARQGRWGAHVLKVLIASTLLAVIALLIVWAIHFRGLRAVSPSPAHSAGIAQRFNAPPSQPKWAPGPN
jgi:hypothetical protein